MIIPIFLPVLAKQNCSKFVDNNTVPISARKKKTELLQLLFSFQLLFVFFSIEYCRQK